MNTRSNMPDVIPEVLLDANHLVDAVISDDENWYDYSLARQISLRDELVREAVNCHFKQCSLYREYALRRGLRACPEDLSKIPLIPTTCFKQTEILSVSRSEIEQWYLSSGTRGQLSHVGRDRLTLERLMGGVRSGVGLIGHWYEDDLTIVNLGPSQDEAANVWFHYVMSLTELMHATVSVQTRGTINWRETTDLIQDTLASGTQVSVVGPPFLVLEFCDYLEESQTSIHAGNRLSVVTAGGWKRFSGQALDRSTFTQRVVACFRLESSNQVRDAFNQVELNTVFFECDHFEKHVPPWVYAAARHPATLEVLPDGEPGIMSYVDASARSYPAMILADDVGLTRRGLCSCGREATRVEIFRRLKTRAEKGCALQMEEFLHDRG